MDTSIVYLEKVEVSAFSHFLKCVRQLSGPIFLFAFFLFTVNSIAAAQLKSAGQNSSGATKWTLAYRSLERALFKFNVPFLMFNVQWRLMGKRRSEVKKKFYKEET